MDRSHRNEFLIGAVLGSIAAGTAALLLAPKSGRKLREDVVDQYNSLHSKKENLTELLKEKSNGLCKYFGKEVETNHTSSALLIGGIAGAFLGATSALFLAPHSGDKLRELLEDKYEEVCNRSEEIVSCLQDKSKETLDKLDDWKDTVVTIIDKLAATKSKGRKRFTADTLTDWADLGMHVIHHLQKRR